MKIDNRFTTLLVCASLILIIPIPARAEPIGLLGQVSPDYPQEVPGWTVEVSGEMQGGGLLPSSPQSSKGNIYFFPANSDTTVSFIFACPQYRSKRSPWITVSKGLGNPYRIMPNVTLRRIRVNTDSASIVPTTTEPQIGFTKVSYQAPVPQKPVRRVSLRQELEEQAELARASHTADIFQFNLEVYEDAYRDQPADVRADIARIKTDEKFRDVAVAPSGRAEIYKQMVLRDRGVKVDIEEDQLYKIATDSTISPTIRAQSVRSMNLKVGSAETQRHINFLREEAYKPSSNLNFVSLVQLIKLGQQTDKDYVMKSLQSTDTQRVSGVLTAIDAAQWKEGSAAVTKLADTSDVATIKELARETVTKLDRVSVDRNELPITTPKKELSAKEQERLKKEQAVKRPLSETPPKYSTQRMSITEAGQGAEAELQIRDLGDGITQIMVVFQSVRFEKGTSNYVLWGVGADKRVVRLAQVVVSAKRPKPEIVATTGLQNLHLFITVEKSADVTEPSGPEIAVANMPGAPPGN